MKLNALNIISFIENLKEELKITEQDIKLIENNKLFRFDLAKNITNFAFENDLKSLEDVSRFNEIEKLYPRLKSTIETYRN